jgi:S-adenosylmethionine/arginine decarboxylase-like enzyme
MGQILEHKHLIVRAELKNPPQCAEAIQDWMKTLVDKIGMKILMGPYAIYSDMVGNRGLTAVTIIETSHIAMHVWDEVSPALMQLDVYTCITLNTADVFAALVEFDPRHVEFTYIDREHNLTLLDKGVV